MADEILYVECQCKSPGHMLRFTLDTEDSFLWIETHLCQFNNFFRRLLEAIRYLFNRPPKSGCGHFDCTIIDPQDIPKIIKLLEKSLG